MAWASATTCEASVGARSFTGGRPTGPWLVHPVFGAGAGAAASVLRATAVGVVTTGRSERIAVMLESRHPRRASSATLGRTPSDRSGRGWGWPVGATGSLYEGMGGAGGAERLAPMASKSPGTRRGASRKLVTAASAARRRS